MKVKSTAIALTALVLVLIASGTLAQHTDPNPTALGHQASWSPEPFPAGSSLPPGYKGLDVVKLWNFLKPKQNGLQKGEYETTAQYEQRLASSTANIAPLVPTDEYALLLQLDFPTEYDADTQTYTVWKPIWCQKTQDYGPNKGWFTCVIGKTSREESHYVGSNAFGVKATIDKTLGNDFGIAVPADTDFFKSEIFSHGPFSRSAPMHELKAKFTVPLAEASKLKGKTIGVLLVGRFNSARFIQGSPTLLSPTIDAPYDEFVTQDALPFTPTKLVLYVEQTGEVLGVKAL